jgi:hypothetical protein
MHILNKKRIDKLYEERLFIETMQTILKYPEAYS